MKIAVTYEGGQVYPHFGHTAAFKIYEAVDGKILSAQVVETNGTGHSALADMLKDMDVDALICGGIGGCARTALSAAGIALYGGVSGDADEAAEALAAGVLCFDPCARCDHHGEGHSCGGHCH